MGRMVDKYNDLSRKEKILADYGATYGQVVLKKGETIQELQNKLHFMKRKCDYMKKCQTLLLNQFYLLEQKFQDLRALADAQIARIAELEGDKKALEMLALEELQIRQRFQEITNNCIETIKKYENEKREAHRVQANLRLSSGKPI